MGSSGLQTTEGSLGGGGAEAQEGPVGRGESSLSYLECNYYCYET